MILIGNNLGERHRDLNSKVAETVATKINFDEMKSDPEKCDIDKLFKIDIASKYKEIDYILEVLKCGDIFHTTRALKCLWLYSDEYSQFINTDYLETITFSCTSEKIKRKILTAIATHMTNSNRSIDFYKYCKEAKLNHYAVKFLVNTPDIFKLDLLKDENNFRGFNDSKFFKQFIGSSFVLALAYLNLRHYSSDIVFKLRFLYSVSNEEYLNILEKHFRINSRYPNCSQRLGIRISRDILKRHRQRIINKPVLYINILNKILLIKHLTIEDVKSLSLALLPSYAVDFWAMNFYLSYKFILDKYHASELFVNLKDMYISKYNDDTFEMRVEFYNLKYYELLNIDEREAWALRHIECDKKLPGIKNYVWYKFVSFHNAFSGIKRYIFLTPDKDERSQIVNILPETARSMEDTNKILCYYYERHVNESIEHKESFINKIIELHDIYSFSNECWTSLDKLLHSSEVYTTPYYMMAEYKFRSLVYHILHSKELPGALIEMIDHGMSFYCFISIIEELSEERKVIVAKYLLSYYAEKIKSLMDHPDYKTIDKDEAFDSDSIQYQIHNLVQYNLWNVIRTFKRTNEDCPEIALQHMNSNPSYYTYHEMYKPKFEPKSEEDFVRWLKKDIQMTVDGIYEIRCNTYRWNFRLGRLFRKLKVYFPNDVGKEYLEYFVDYLSDVPKGHREYRNIKMAVVGVFYLADLNFIISFLEQNVPVASKIDHMNINKRLLLVQKAICRLAYHPRPPLPLCYFQKYITGDYVHFCLPVFNHYFANLPSNEKFIEVLLDAPLSIQKHGLRLAFKAYDTDLLIPIIISAWKRTKNVSLRMILYETLFNRILKESEEVQKELYEVLKLYTSELNHDDHDIVYSLLVSDDLPDVLKADFIEKAWLTVSKLADKSVDINRRISVICHMEKYIYLVQRDFPRLQIIDGLVDDMLCKKNINKDYDEYHNKELTAKWELTAKYIVSFTNEVEHRKSLELMQTIMSQCIESWDLIKRETYTVRKFMQQFIKTIVKKDPMTVKSCADTVFIYQCILNNLQTSLKKEEIYLLNWDLQLSIKCRNVMYNARKETDEPRHYMSYQEIAVAYGNEVIKILISLVKNNEFYHCFYQSIADIIINSWCTICSILYIDSYSYVYYLSDRLTDTKMTETHVLALLMLPRDPSCYWESEHMEIIKKIKQFESKEVRHFLYEKYVLSDCLVRRYVK